MPKSFPKLFEPVNIGKVKIKNRIAMAPMGIIGLTTPEGHPTQRAIDYYIERAKGGLGFKKLRHVIILMKEHLN